MIERGEIEKTPCALSTIYHSDFASVVKNLPARPSIPKSSSMPNHSDNPTMLTLLDGRPSPTSTNPIERRRGLRIKQERPLKIYEPRSSRYYPGQTADISLSGLRVTLPNFTPLIPGSTLCLHIAHATSALASKHQMIQAKVIWTQRDETQLTAGLELVSTAAIQASAA